MINFYLFYYDDEKKVGKAAFCKEIVWRKIQPAIKNWNYKQMNINNNNLN